MELRISFDIDISYVVSLADAHGVPIRGSLLLPLLELEKQTLSDIDVRDANDRPVNILKSSENAHLRHAAFLRSESQQSDLTPAMFDRYTSFAGSFAGEPDEFLHSGEYIPQIDNYDLVVSLRTDPEEVQLARTDSVLTVVKMRHRLTDHDPARFQETWRSGFWSTELVFTHRIVTSRGHVRPHLRVLVPDGIVATKAHFSDDVSHTSRGIECSPKLVTAHPATVDGSNDSPSRLTVICSVATTEVFRIWSILSMSLAIAFLAWLIWGLDLGVYMESKSIEFASNGFLSLLALGPALLAVYLSRPSVHFAFARAMRAQTYAMILGSFALAILAIVGLLQRATESRSLVSIVLVFVAVCWGYVTDSLLRTVQRWTPRNNSPSRVDRIRMYATAKTNLAWVRIGLFAVLFVALLPLLAATLMGLLPHR